MQCLCFHNHLSFSKKINMTRLWFQCAPLIFQTFGMPLHKSNSIQSLVAAKKIEYYSCTVKFPWLDERKIDIAVKLKWMKQTKLIIFQMSSASNYHNCEDFISYMHQQFLRLAYAMAVLGLCCSGGEMRAKPEMILCAVSLPLPKTI